MCVVKGDCLDAPNMSSETQQPVQENSKTEGCKKSVTLPLKDSCYETLPSLVPTSDSSSNSEGSGFAVMRRANTQGRVTHARATAPIPSNKTPPTVTRSQCSAVTHARTTAPKPPLPVMAARAAMKCAEAGASCHHSVPHAPEPLPPPASPCLPSSLKPSRLSSSSERSSSDGKPHVSFGDLEVRNYAVVLGDHPDCSSGPPVSVWIVYCLYFQPVMRYSYLYIIISLKVSIGWEYSVGETMPVESYEALKPRRRSMDQLELNYFVRKRMLRRISGVTDEEMREAMDQVHKIQKQRIRTKRRQPLYKSQEAVMALAQKLGSALSIRRSDRK